MSEKPLAADETPAVLLVDADADARQELERIFTQADFRVLTAGDAATALRLVHAGECKVIVLDFDLPGVSGAGLCRLLRSSPSANARVPIIITLKTSDEARATEARAAGADDVVVKTDAPHEILRRTVAHVEAAMREQLLAGSNRELAFLADLGRSLLHSHNPKRVMQQVAGATYAATDAALCAAIWQTAAPDKQARPSLLAAVFDRDGSLEDESLIRAGKFETWRQSAPVEAGLASVEHLTERARFIINDRTHTRELIAPLRFGERITGALIVAFDRTHTPTETEMRMIEAAAQTASLAAHIAENYSDITRRAETLAAEVTRRTEEIQQHRRLTEAIVDSLPVSLYAINRRYEIVAWNRHRELGAQGIPREQALGKPIFEVLTRQPRAVLEKEFQRVFETADIERIEQTSTDEQGKTRHWLISKVPMYAEDDASEVSHVITVGEEISERVEAARAVARAEKLAAVGRLAAGVVHEINNPLATISACAEALESRVEEGAFGASPDVDELKEYLALIRSETMRCKTITNGLLDFSRVRAGAHRPVQIKKLLDSTARLLTHQQRKRNIKINVEADDDLPLISGDEGQLQQAVIALATNAIDAMLEGGTLTLRARPNTPTSLTLEVADTGHGIAPEDLPKIFDPFFTTKEIGQGTGLGLAVCYGIVTEHGGRITVESAIGRGTTFTITLPVNS